MHTYQYYKGIINQFDTHDYTDKESYLGWVCDWKECYKELTADIRSLRQELSKPHGSINGYVQVDIVTAQCSKAKLRFHATLLLVIRKEGKRRSWELKQLNIQKA